ELAAEAKKDLGTQDLYVEITAFRIWPKPSETDSVTQWVLSNKEPGSKPPLSVDNTRDALAADLAKPVADPVATVVPQVVDAIVPDVVPALVAATDEGSPLLLPVDEQGRYLPQQYFDDW